MRIYISGPMTGVPEFNHPAFNEAARLLRKRGYEVFSPTENGLPATATWEEHMRADLAELMTCTHVATLPGWAQSKGVRIEVKLAGLLGIPVGEVSSYPYYFTAPAQGGPFDDVAQNIQILAEECAEVIQMQSKIARFGIDDHYPNRGMTNRHALEQELGHVKFMVDLLIKNGTVSTGGIEAGRVHKAEKMPVWYQRPVGKSPALDAPAPYTDLPSC